ncbi:hypothetical protein CC78DRAFT_223531 [Lojkania enalia]|uniref:Uncharacterized protein n=1 Tax=Lojkania enalia TaxID=147567 RepID=A0A9P4K8M2_9PLEO|nr:hypothetical protein CC78DRAFT_223531 [Didymosphaeria enalia]
MAQNDHEMHSLVRSLPNPSQPQPKNLNEESTPASPRSSITVRERPATTLHGNFYPVLGVCFYSVLALLAWTLVCILSHRPLRGTKSYSQPSSSYRVEPNEIITANEKFFKAVDILRIIVALLTIPITSFVCSMAAVTYMQAGQMRRSLTLRQLMALSDQGWIRPSHLLRIAKTGSLPLCLAFFLVVLGSLSQIIQNAFISHESIKLPSLQTQGTATVKDIPDLFTNEWDDRGEINFRLQRLLDAASEYDQEANLWNEDLGTLGRSLNTFDIYSSTTTRQATYFVELPSNFSTGTVGQPQFAPRVSSNTSYDEITEDEFRACRNETENGGFYAAYNFTTPSNYEYGVIACMEGDKRVSPWKPIRDRQDISEDLYLQFAIDQRIYYLKASANTSLGYFELPSYSNGNRPGPLLDKDPLGPDSTQVMGNSIQKRLVAADTHPGNKTLISVVNRGPLTTFALALFGNNSYIARHVNHPEAYTETRPAWIDDRTRRPDTWLCVEVSPLSTFMRLPCVAEWQTINNGLKPVVDWLAAMATYDVFESALGAGVFLANKLWLGTSNRLSDERNLMIDYDPGTEMLKPKISKRAIIAGSVLLGIHLLGLWVLAVYTAIMMPWANGFGEVMLRVGASLSDEIKIVDGVLKGKTLDGLPGFIGDAAPAEHVGRIGVGAAEGMRRKRKYLYLQ